MGHALGNPVAALIIGSCIFYVYSDLPPVAQDVLWWNPLVHIVSHARTGFYPTYEAPYVSFAYVFAFALTFIAFGLIFMRAWYKTALEG